MNESVPRGVQSSTAEIDLQALWSGDAAAFEKKRSKIALLRARGVPADDAAFYAGFRNFAHWEVVEAYARASLDALRDRSLVPA
jgi:hypothetical protein